MDDQGLLDEYGDMVLRCDAGADLACERFTMVRSCSVIRNVMEDVELDRDARGRAVVPVPGLPREALQLAIALLHGVKTTVHLRTAEECECALRGLSCLGNDTLTNDVLLHMWDRLKFQSLGAIRPHLDVLLHGTTRACVLRYLMRVCPTWTQFREVLAEVSMDLTLAAWLLENLKQHFPAGLLVGAILPRVRADPDALVALLTGLKGYIMSGEVRDILCHLRAACPGVTCGLLDAMRDAQPHTFSQSSFFWERGRGTVVVGFSNTQGHVVVKPSSWATLTVDWDAGKLTVRLHPMHSEFRNSRVQVRVMAYTPDESVADGVLASYESPTGITEVWYEGFVLTKTAKVTSTFAVVRGSLEGVADALKTGRTEVVRVDVFLSRFISYNVSSIH